MLYRSGGHSNPLSFPPDLLAFQHFHQPQRQQVAFPKPQTLSTKALRQIASVQCKDPSPVRATNQFTYYTHWLSKQRSSLCTSAHIPQPGNSAGLDMRGIGVQSTPRNT